MSERPTPETDYQRKIDNGETGPLLDFAERLEIERDAERALADRLASEVEDYILCQADLGQSMATLAAWKEARSE